MTAAVLLLLSLRFFKCLTFPSRLAACGRVALSETSPYELLVESNPNPKLGFKLLLLMGAAKSFVALTITRNH